ncbi:hypothetical protein CHGG_10744 [Chaetomium globosum CBS 148.51]|uniref:AMP-dependent synthetase/ligase domain-containing protein n=1 Tax=Chaetomium globosum (strain ATCC 6205 / CBS 148.51 / DSM 1962 / NBRC 6347 / NRRL 1970) TaxID=306901 RepID=Q2GMR0_CHAGB|nr:uncharacterized protein CHGG_10744 [Chaetomium globosum CBS 148.51]EAQ82926.1 hypothetical protein CHGG_10744 [Chaetomium globosum CBS 148.51]
MTPSRSLAQLDGGPQAPYGSSVWSILQNGVDVNPDRAALISAQQPPGHLGHLVGPGLVQSPAVRGPDEILTWSYAQMRRGAARLATVLARHGVPPHSTLLSFIPHSAEWALLLWVSAVRCLTVISQMPQALRLPEKTAELRTCFAMMPAVIVVQDEAAAQLVDETKAAPQPARTSNDTTPPFLGLCLSRLSEPRRGWISLADVAEMSFTDSESAINPSDVDDRLDRVAQIFFTSGSSGTPKGVPKTVKNLAACTATMADPQPGSTVGVIIGGNFAALASTMPLLLENRNFSLEKITSLRRIVLGGEIITKDFLSRAREVLPGPVVLPGFGMSEVAGLFGWLGGVPDPIPNYNGVVSCGKPLPGTRIRVVNEKGLVASLGEAGEMHVGTEGTVERYMHTQPGGKSDTFYEDEFGPWFTTGDISVLDEAGYVYIVGRKKELIRNVTGIIQPHTIESCLSAAFNVQTCVVALPSPMNGDVPYPIVARLPEGVSPGDMREHFINAVGSSYSLGTILTLEQLGMKSWPLTATGKVFKRELERAAVECMRKDPRLGLASYAIASS